MSDGSAAGDDRPAAATVAALRDSFPANVADADAGRVAAVVLAALGAAVAVLVAGEVFPFRSLNHDEGVPPAGGDAVGGAAVPPAPVEDAFRPWFFVESERGMYSKYAPVPAATFALGELLGGYTVALAGIAAGLVAGTVALGRELFDARVGALAGVLLLATPLFVVHSGVFLPYMLTGALNVAFAVWYLRGERRRSRRDATLAGLAVGLAFFARPYTAVLFALPFVGHAVVTLATGGGWRVPFAAAGVAAAGAPGPDARALFARRAITAALGSAGVAAALGYNAVVTGDPFVFPYLAFAPEDGVGFGERAILGHEVDYTVDLALEANALVLETLFTDWVVAGAVGTAVAAGGVALALAGRTTAGAGGRTPRVRRGLLAATVATVAAGNVAFWGNYNVLGALDDPTDGLIHYLGPYYHFDLIVPTAVFAAVALVTVGDTAWARLRAAVAGRDVDRRAVGAVGAAVVFVVAGAGGAVAAGAVTETVDRNEAVTSELRAGYGPLADDGAPDDAVVFLPTPYGPWLNHPFQTLLNDPDYDGDTVYALGDTRELAVSEAFPERDLYRYVYTGSWVPVDDSTVRGRSARSSASRASGWSSRRRSSDPQTRWTPPSA
ncbi:ArnT family glycosyltransferase [Halobaculum litoreum]|uniref:ArnT family glycosyltransferase n=1 Tax=Halobaculum litoreum TaxID=3031998 RepID=A0ABD5XS14_9EURY